MTAPKSLGEFYGGQFFRKMIHSFLNLIYSPSARLASAMQIVTELCLTDTCKFFQTSKREYPGIFQIHFSVNWHCRVEAESAACTIFCRLGNSILNQPVIDPRVIIRVNELRPLREHDGIRQINRDRRYRRNKFPHTTEGKG